MLRRREVNIVCTVDLYNEGVDIPEIDTVLFLRPTESLTVFLQQLGRGLRLHDDKDCLTVLDFVCYQELFMSGAVAADANGDGVLNILDFVAFQGQFLAGCR